MNNTTNQARSAPEKKQMIGLRLDPSDYDQVKQMAKLQNRSAANMALVAMRLGLERMRQGA